jgi:hypothetical protein
MNLIRHVGKLLLGSLLRLTGRSGDYALIDRKSVYRLYDVKSLPNGDLFNQIALRVLEHGRTLMDVQRLHVLWSSVRNTFNVTGDVCEVGVYKGGSSYFLALAYKQLGGNPELHAIDTFQGHADGTISSVDTYHTVGMFSDTSYESVRDYLGDFANVSVHKGEFSSVAPKLSGFRFRLVHIDTDLYQPTLDCLEFFSPKMNQGGVIIIDDYLAKKCPGVTRAVHEFCKFHPEYDFWYFHTEQIVLVRNST